MLQVEQNLGVSELLLFGHHFVPPIRSQLAHARRRLPVLQARLPLRLPRRAGGTGKTAGPSGIQTDYSDVTKKEESQRIQHGRSLLEWNIASDPARVSMVPKTNSTVQMSFELRRCRHRDTGVQKQRAPDRLAAHRGVKPTRARLCQTFLAHACNKCSFSPSKKGAHTFP